MPPSKTILNAFADIKISVDVVAGITAQGLIDLLVDFTDWSAVPTTWSL